MTSRRSSGGGFDSETATATLVDFLPSPEYYAYWTKDPTGIPIGEVDSVDLDFDDTTRTLTVDGNFTYLYQGREVEFSGPVTVQWPNTTGLCHFYFNGDDELVADTSITFLDIIRDNAYFANLYWNASRSEVVLAGDELHELMPWQAHLLQHQYNGGTSYGSGCIIGGDLDTHAQFSMTNGTFLDEDRHHSFGGKSVTVEFQTWAKEGLSGDWFVAAVDSAPVVMSGGVPQP